MTVLGTRQQVRASVVIPIDDGWACRMPRQMTLVQGTLVREPPLVRLGRDISQQIYAASVDQEIDFPITIPIGETELAASALASLALIQPQRLAGCIEEHAPAGGQQQSAVAASTAEERQVSFVVQHHQIVKDSG